MTELWDTLNQPGLQAHEGKERTTAYPSFKYSLLKTSLPGCAFGARFRWGSGVETFFSAKTFLNSDVRFIDMFRSANANSKMRGWGGEEVKKQGTLHASLEIMKGVEECKYEIARDFLWHQNARVVVFLGSSVFHHDGP